MKKTPFWQLYREVFLPSVLPVSIGAVIGTCIGEKPETLTGWLLFWRWLAIMGLLAFLVLVGGLAVRKPWKDKRNETTVND